MKKVITFISLMISGQFTLAAESPETIDDCGCDRTIPVTGSYTIHYPEKIDQPATDTVLVSATEHPSDRSDPLFNENLVNVPGSQVVIIGQGTSADLVCQGNKYAGIMEHMSQYMELVPEQTGAKGIQLGTRFHGFIQRPDGIGAFMNEASIPKILLVKTMGDGTATPEMCDTARFDMEYAKRMRDIHSDPDILQKALDRNLGAYSNEEWISPSGNTPTEDFNDRTLPNQDEDEVETYQSLISEAATKALKELGGSSGGSYNPMYTDPRTCKPSKQPPRRENGHCKLSITLAAEIKHEEQHQKTCNNMKEDESKHSRYRWWVNYPPNLSKDEQAAYSDQIKLLQTWLDRNC